MSRQPPLNSLRFFEAAARLGSFVKAGEELHLTHGAVSRQIRMLEESLGVALFERRNRGVFLTPQGDQLLAAVQYAFGHLNTAVEALRKPAHHQPLVVSCEPTISMKWLIPRLPDFHRRHPDVQLHIFASGGPVAFQRDGVDVALRRNDFQWQAGVHAEKVCDEWIGPVCAPSLLKRRQLDLSTQKLLHTSSRKNAWAAWRGATGMPAAHNGAQTYEHFYLTLQAAGAGLGVAIGSVFMVEEELANGRLAAPLGFVRDGSEYCLLSLQPFEADPRRAAFLHWLRQQMRYGA
ncbi:LysR family transcriptional regulator [Duganella sp. FT80W]|uniref:LysR family transcriptional regulator n=1 Tax=Duganella guangzhouensis TaxID=2666084 RepID=A0A6I2LB63_9BURK|nr:LysR substrate-binding domain-containing protein [Duganella guangzhouensis]MRW94064.1 LysR family transcriptional regulator [Duganella guangzhouensis]